MTITDEMGTSAASLNQTLLEAVERGASLLAGGERAVGPASPQDGLDDLVPSDDAIGIGSDLGDGLFVAVMLTPDLCEELTGHRDSTAVVAEIGAVIEEMAAGLGRPVSELQTLAGPADLTAALTGRDSVMASGVFAGESVVATVVVGCPSDGVEPAGGPGSGVGADGSSSAAAPDSVDSVVGAPSSGPGTAIPPRGAPADPAPLPGVAAPPRIADDALARGLQILGEVNLEVTAELGRAALRVSDLLELEPGAIIELDRDAGAPVELFVNGTLFARAEVVVVDGSYAVKISELLGGEASR